MWQFSQCIDGMTKACEELETPITGGNVSFYNETLGIGIYPTPVVGIVGVIEDVSKAVKPDFREEGRAVLLLSGSERGDAADAEAEFGSSEYAKEILGQLWGFPPALELEKEVALQKAIIELIDIGLLDSAKDISEGGLATALAESGFGNGVGVRVELFGAELAPEFVLFGEDASRIVVSCDPELVARIKQVGSKHGIRVEQIGSTIRENFEIVVDGKVVVSAPVRELKEAWSHALERALHVETEERLVPELLQRS
jgi:phosphoribosylformylglycinamidine synthase subunit PurL